MKRIIAGLMVGLFCLTLLASPAVPWKYPDNRPPTMLSAHDHTESGDDTGWEEPFSIGGTAATSEPDWIISLPLLNPIYIVFWYKFTESVRNYDVEESEPEPEHNEFDTSK